MAQVLTGVLVYCFFQESDMTVNSASVCVTFADKTWYSSSQAIKHTEDEVSVWLYSFILIVSGSYCKCVVLQCFNCFSVSVCK